MEIQITATNKITTLDGVECRLWEGMTASGIPCKVFVHRIGVHRDQDAGQFEAELQKMMPPAGTPKVIPLSHIL